MNSPCASPALTFRSSSPAIRACLRKSVAAMRHRRCERWIFIAAAESQGASSGSGFSTTTSGSMTGGSPDRRTSVSRGVTGVFLRLVDRAVSSDLGPADARGRASFTVGGPAPGDSTAVGLFSSCVMRLMAFPRIFARALAAAGYSCGRRRSWRGGSHLIKAWLSTRPEHRSAGHDMTAIVSRLGVRVREQGWAHLVENVDQTFGVRKEPFKARTRRSAGRRR